MCNNEEFAAAGAEGERQNVRKRHPALLLLLLLYGCVLRPACC
jgi:hypothetical protein